MGEGPFANAGRAVLCGGLCFAASMLLAGCNETTGSIKQPLKAAATAPVRNANVSPRGASVALNLTGVENVPPAIVSRFSEALAHAADMREISVVDPKLAKYFVQMHLTAYPAGPGATALAYVVDIFDARKNRAQRLGDDVVLKGTAADSWTLVDDTALEAIAARSADELAAFLSNTPEAVAVASAPAVIMPPAEQRRETPRVPAVTSPGMPAGALGFSAVR
jgi:hypothetical protein